MDGKTTDITAEIPFDIPDGWEWVRLKSICSKIGSGSTPTGGRQIYVPDGIKFLREQNIYNDGLRTDGLAYITDEINKQHNGSQVFARDILMNITGGSIGRTALVDDNFDIANINQHILIIRLIELKMRFFIHRHLLSPYIISLMFDKQTGDKPGLSMEKVARFLMALPPLAEQQRIVSQINHLMTEVDKIDAEAKELDNALSLAKQKVLDLAIRGKLVPQDPNDEPASELLKRIKAEKEALIKAGKIKRDKHESFIFRGDDNRYYEDDGKKQTDITPLIPFDLPKNWTWCRFGSLGIVNPRNTIPDDTIVSFMPMNQLSAGYCSKYELSERQWKEVKQGFTHFAENDLVFAKITPCFQNRKSAVMHDLKNGFGAGTTELHVLRGNPELIYPEYALLFVKTQHFIADAVATIQGVVGQQRIDGTFLKDYLFPLPPLAEQKRIVSQIELVFAQLETMQK